MKYFFILLFSMMQILPLSFAQEYSKWELPEGALARIGKGHITGSIVFSPDSKMLVIPSSIGIWLYDATTYKELKLLTADVSNIVFSPDGLMFAANDSSDNSVELWDISYDPIQMKHITTLKGHSKDITSIKFAPDGNTIATASEDRTIILWDLNTGKNKSTLTGHTKEGISIVFSPDNSMLASGSEDGTVRLWNTETGDQIYMFNVQSKPLSYSDAVYSVAFSPDNRALVSLTSDGTIRLFDTKSGKHIRTLKGKMNGVVSERFKIAFSPDKRTIVSTNYDKTELWTIRTRKLLWEHKGRIHISPDWSQYATSEQGSIKIWDMKERKLVKSLSDSKLRSRPLVFSPDGNKLGNDLVIWDVDSNKHVFINEEHGSIGSPIRFIHDGNTIASWGYKQIQLWDINTQKQIRTFSGEVTAMSSNGMMVAIGIKKVYNWNEPYFIQLWNTRTGEGERIISTDNKENLQFLHFSPGGKTLVSRGMSYERTLKLWDVDTGEHKLTINTKPYNVNSIEFFPDSQTLIGLGNNDIPLWNVETGELMTTLKGHTGGVDYIVFSPDESVLASASYDETVRIWNAKTFELIATLIGHTEKVTSIVFFPNGETVATSSFGVITRTWDTKTGQLKKTPLEHEPHAIHPDGKTLISLGADTIQFVDTKTWESILMLDNHTDYISTIIVSKDGKTIASVGSTILLWKVDNPNLLPVNE